MFRGYGEENKGLGLVLIFKMFYSPCDEVMFKLLNNIKQGKMPTPFEYFFLTPVVFCCASAIASFSGMIAVILNFKIKSVFFVSPGKNCLFIKGSHDNGNKGFMHRKMSFMKKFMIKEVYFT